MSRWVVLIGALIAGCGDLCDVPQTASLEADEVRGPLMRPGTNCLRCHSASGEAKAKPFSVGGTIFPKLDASACEGVEGVTVRVTDSAGKRVTMRSNAVGNFWSSDPLEPPLSMEIEREGRVATMPVTAPIGGCALCHSWPDAISASGRIRAP